MDLKTLDSQLIESSIKSIINSDNWSVILTLNEGDLLFGDFNYRSIFFSGTPKEAKNSGLWIPDKWESLPPDSRCAYQIRPVCLAFNSKHGTIYGKYHHVEIKDKFISGIRPLFWTEESLSSLKLKNAPNPIASLVCEHNFKVVEKYGLYVAEIIECALPETGIPPNGISFAQDEIIYADWDFFSRLAGGSLSAGAYGVSLSMERSLYQLVHDKIKDGIIEKISKITKFLLGRKLIGECRIQGFIVVPKKMITTSIEGEECIVVICSDQKSFNAKAKFMPVILKKKSISYPSEFLPFLNSRLVFYGEIKQVPIKINNKASNYALIARAIGYIK